MSQVPSDLRYTKDHEWARDNGDGTVSDLVTGLMWVKARGSKMTWAAAFTNAAACKLAGFLAAEVVRHHR